MKVLGVLIDLDLSGASQRTETRRRLQKGLNAFAAGKMYAIASVFIPRVRYSGQFMAWTEEQLNPLDLLIRIEARQMLEKTPSFTNVLLHHLDTVPSDSVVNAIVNAKCQQYEN
jgi:hypothetical protein